MVDDEGELVAEAQGVFRPGDNDLPPAPSTDDEASDSEESTPPPASFMPVHTTPYGVVCLN